MKKMIKNFMERLNYDGLTIEEMNKLAGGGGKKGPAPEAAKDRLMFSPGAGDLLKKAKGTLKEDNLDKSDSINRKSLGTRGLQIPLTASKSTTKTAANTGVQV